MGSSGLASGRSILPCGLLLIKNKNIVQSFFSWSRLPRFLFTGVTYRHEYKKKNEKKKQQQQAHPLSVSFDAVDNIKRYVEATLTKKILNVIH